MMVMNERFLDCKLPPMQIVDFCGAIDGDKTFQTKVEMLHGVVTSANPGRRMLPKLSRQLVATSDLSRIEVRIVQKLVMPKVFRSSAYDCETTIGTE